MCIAYFKAAQRLSYGSGGSLHAKVCLENVWSCINETPVKYYRGHCIEMYCISNDKVHL